MTTLVHTSPEGPAGQQLSLITSAARARSQVLTLDSSLVDNVSLVAGTTVTQALNNLSGTIGALNSNQVLNASTVAGVTVTDALDALNPSAAVRIIGYTAAAPLVVQMLPAGHTPGYYLLSLAAIIRTAAATGTITRSYQFSTPTLGATQIAGFGAVAITALGPPAGSFTTLSAYSDGVSAVTVTLTPAAVTGAPVIDVTAKATFLGA